MRHAAKQLVVGTGLVAAYFTFFAWTLTQGMPILFFWDAILAIGVGFLIFGE